MKDSSPAGCLRNTLENEILTWDKPSEPVEENEILPSHVIVTLSNMIYIEKEG
jgi:hypothetical protein